MTQLNLFCNLPKQRKVKVIRRGEAVVLRGAGLLYKVKTGEVVIPPVPNDKGARNAVR